DATVDVLPDDIATPARLAAYGKSIAVSEGERKWKDLEGADLSRFEAHATVRVSASHPAAGGELTVHFVNYDRTAPKEKRSAGSGIADEKPRPVSGIKADLRLPPGTRATGVQALSPEQARPRDLRFDSAEDRVRFAMPEVLVYGVARVRLTAADRAP